MELQQHKPTRPSRPVISFQMRASNMRQIPISIDNPKHHQHHHHNSSAMNAELEMLFERTGLVSQVFCEQMSRHEHKAMMSVGVCLSSQNITLFLKAMGNEVGRSIHGINKVTDKKEMSNQIYYITSINYKIENCTIVYWIIQDLLLKEMEDQMREVKKILDIFVNYPQVIIVDSYIRELIRYKKKNDNKLFQFQQNIVVIGNINQRYENIHKQQQAHYKINYLNNIDIAFIKNIILLTMKRNSTRCFHEFLKINIFVMQSLYLANSSANKQKYEPTHDEYLTETFQAASSKYLSEVQRQYDLFSQAMRNRAAKNEKQLQYELNEYEEFCMKEIRKNIHILGLKEEEKKYFQPMEKVIYVNNQQIMTNNRQLIKKQNNELLTELFDKLLSQFDKGRYNNTKDKIYLMACDLELMMRQYEKRAIKSCTTFWLFNTFMRNNRHRYYEKIQEIEQQIDHNKKNQNFDQIFDKIQIKKKVLITLEKQVKNLENKKNVIEKQNQHLKKLQKELNQKPFYSDDQQIMQADSIKTTKSRPIIIQRLNKNQSNVVLSIHRNKNKLKSEKIQKKNKCLECCQII